MSRGIRLLENSGLNGSEVGAVLATQENSYDYVRVLGGLGGPVAESSTVSARPRHQESHARNNYEPEEWEYSEEDQIDESAWSFWSEHDTWDTGWDESYWDDTSHWNYQPQYLTDPSLDLSSVIQDGSVDGSPVAESDDGDVQVTMSAMNNAGRTFTAARAC